MLSQNMAVLTQRLSSQSGALACRRFCKLSSLAVALMRVLSSASSEKRPVLSLKLKTRVGPSARTATCTRRTSALGACTAGAGTEYYLIVFVSCKHIIAFFCVISKLMKATRTGFHDWNLHCQCLRYHYVCTAAERNGKSMPSLLDIRPVCGLLS